MKRAENTSDYSDCGKRKTKLPVWLTDRHNRSLSSSDEELEISSRPESYDFFKDLPRFTEPATLKAQPLSQQVEFTPEKVYEDLPHPVLNVTASKKIFPPATTIDETADEENFASTRDTRILISTSPQVESSTLKARPQYQNMNHQTSHHSKYAGCSSGASTEAIPASRNNQLRMIFGNNSQSCNYYSIY